MTMTLVEIAERVASYCNASHINSINDSDEALRIANIIKECYEEMILSKEIQTALELFQLQSVSDDDVPTRLELPEKALTLDIVKYTNSQNKIYSPIYVEPMTFIDRSLNEDIEQEFVKTVTDKESGAVYNIRTNKDPSFYTIMSGTYLIFDSYNRDFEDSIQGRHALVYGHTLPEFKLEDDFIPDIQEQQFPVLVSRAKVAADMELRNNFNELEHDRSKKLFINTDTNSKSWTRGTSRWNNRITFRV